MADGCWTLVFASEVSGVMMKSWLVSLSMQTFNTQVWVFFMLMISCAVMFGWKHRFWSSRFVLPFLILCHHVLQAVSHTHTRRWKRRVDYQYENMSFNTWRKRGSWWIVCFVEKQRSLTAWRIETSVRIIKMLYSSILYKYILHAWVGVCTLFICTVSPCPVIYLQKGNSVKHTRMLYIVYIRHPDSA